VEQNVEDAEGFLRLSTGKIKAEEFHLFVNRIGNSLVGIEKKHQAGAYMAYP
jgi:hypothetical protein